MDAIGFVQKQSLNVKICGSERAVRLHDDHDVVGAVGEGLDLAAPVIVVAKVGAEARNHERREREQAQHHVGHFSWFLSDFSLITGCLVSGTVGLCTNSL